MLKRFFQNIHINQIYVHSALQHMAEQIGIIFGPIFMLHHGYSVSAALGFWVGLYTLRLVIRVIYARFFNAIRLKGGIFLGLLFYMFSMGVLPFAQQPVFLLVYLLLFSAGATFYWTAYNTLMGRLGDQEHRGKQLSMLNLIVVFTAAGAPLLSGWIAASFGFSFLFVANAGLVLLSAWPILNLPDVVDPLPPFKGTWNDPANRWVVQTHFWSALNNVGVNIIWPIAVFLMIGNVLTFGAVVTAGMLLLAMLQVFIGLWIDKGKGYGLFRIGLGVRWVQALLRAFVVTTPAGIVVSEALSVGDYLMTQAGADFYNMSKKARNDFWYFYWGEVGFDVGGILTLLVAIGFYAVGLSLPMAIAAMTTLGLLGLGTIILRSKVGRQLT